MLWNEKYVQLYQFFQLHPIRANGFPIPAIYGQLYPIFQFLIVLLANWIRRGDPHGKRCGNNDYNKDEDNSPKTLNDKNVPFFLLKIFFGIICLGVCALILVSNKTIEIS